MTSTAPVGSQLDALQQAMEASEAMDALAEAVADRVLDVLLERLGPSAGDEPLAWTTADVARELRRSEEWVRDHRDELGLIASPGRRPRLLFDPAAVRAWATARSTGETSQAMKRPSTLAERRPARRRAGTGASLLPVGTDRRTA